jgi:hypothetical protein
MNSDDRQVKTIKGINFYELLDLAGISIIDAAAYIFRRPTDNEIPYPSVNTRRFVPNLPLSIGLEPVNSPLKMPL